MSKTLLERLINSVLLQELKTDELQSGPLGKIVFAKQRVDDVEYEKNTPDETKLQTALMNHITDNDSEELENNIDLIKFLLNTGKYKDFLKPKSKFVYRILSDIPLDYFKSYLDFSDEEIDNKSNKIVKSNISYILQPERSKIQSWSTDINQNTFNTLFINNLKKNNALVLLKADTSSSGLFFINSDFLKKFKFYQKYAGESEVISYGPVKIVETIFYINNTEDTLSSFKLINKMKSLL